MPRRLASTLFVCLAVCAAAADAAAQQWNDERTRALVERAVALRAQQLADTGLRDYRATAHGYVTFLAQLGEGFPEPPRIVKADELVNEVYWRAPASSKQIIMATRDTTVLPTDISYHRDHLGIVQNNFPSVIRIGEGDEVRDVPHPLSAAGLAEYDYAISDSLSIRLPDRTIDVMQVRVRPKNAKAPRVIGAVYIDRQEAQVVRMAFNFTRAAFLDEQLEDLAVVLENGLIAGRFWLPRRQEIEIQRTGTWLDYPARGIIRGRWEIRSYEVNTGLDPKIFGGSEIVMAPPSVRAQHKFEGRILDSLPADVRVATPEDVRKVQEEARQLVRAQALARARTPAISARGISDLVRVDRVEGLALGAGVSRRFGSGITASLRGRYGIDDHQPKGEASFGWQRPSGVGLSALAYRIYRDVGEVDETSPIISSISAQEFGADRRDPFDVKGIGLRLDLGSHLSARWSISGARESHGGLDVHARPASGTYEPTIPALALNGTVGSILVDHPTAPSFFGTEAAWSLGVRGMRFTPRPVSAINRILLAPGFDRPGDIGHATAKLRIERPIAGGQRVIAYGLGAGAFGNGRLRVPQELVFLGGPVSAPGHAYHSLIGTMGFTGRLEYQRPMPFPALSLGRFGKTGGGATVAMYGQATSFGNTSRALVHEGSRSSVGLAVLLFYNILRVDVAAGEGLNLSIDVTRDFWRVL